MNTEQIYRVTFTNSYGHKVTYFIAANDIKTLLQNVGQEPTSIQKVDYF